MSNRYQNHIGGKWVDALGGETFENRNPANWEEVVGIFPKSSKEDVDRAVESAREGFEEWRRVPVPTRGQILKRASDLLVERKEEYAQDMTREMGKVLDETRGDIQEAIDTGYYAFGEGRRFFGKTAPSELKHKATFTTHLPLGVVGVICPWNFPMAIPSWKIFPALLAGNAVVFKPASDVPLSGANFIRALLDAGVPPKVVNLVHGSGSGVGRPLIEHPDVPALSFTGSSAVGKKLAESAAATLKRVSLELGGKNAQIVWKDADLDLALEGVLWGAYGTTGQRCTATSRLILHEEIRDEFLQMLKEAVEGLELGDGLEASTDVGPLVNEGQLKTVDDYVKIGKEEGATLFTGGEPYEHAEARDGFFYLPTVFTDVEPEMRIAKEEIFGPVLSVLTVSDWDEAVRVHNNTDYGLSSALYTRDINLSFHAMEDLIAGITYINAPTIGAECHMPFGGCKETGNGHREGGWGPYEFFTETKTVYVDFSGRLQRAQIDTEDV
ncbi:MAG: aldehyde dehydrogenase family protein [bacterium]